MSRIVGHYAPGLLAAMVGALIVLTVVPGVASYVPWEAQTSLVAVAVGLAFSIFAHNRHLCERCIASVPLDASAAAVRYRVRFRVAHYFERRAVAFGYLATVVATSFVYSHPVGRYGWAAVQASLVYLLLVYVTHQRLRPWCPHCGNGGQERTVPTTPTPVSTGV